MKHKNTWLGIVLLSLILYPLSFADAQLVRREQIQNGIENLRLCNISATTNPTVNEDSGDGYEVGSCWINTTTGQYWRAVSVSVGAAVWKDLTSGGISSAYTTISPSSGSNVSANGSETLLFSSTDGSVEITGFIGDPDRINFRVVSGGGTIDGSGTADFLPKWTDSNTLTSSIVKEVSGGLEVGDVSTNSHEQKYTAVTGAKSVEWPNLTGTVALVSKEFPFAGCDNTTAGSVWDLPTSSAAVAACLTGTNTQQGVLTFANGQSAQMHFYLPPLPTAAVANLVLIWSAAETSSTGTWALTAVCTPINSTAADDPSFGAFWAPSQDTSGGTANFVKSTVGSAVSLPASCVGGNVFMHLKLAWTAGTATDFDAKTLYVRF